MRWTKKLNLSLPLRSLSVLQTKTTLKREKIKPLDSISWGNQLEKEPSEKSNWGLIFSQEKR
jgi:hypothetical protein